MRILLFSQYFPPEVGATQARVFSFAKGLVRAGFEVVVITEFPNHPKGVIPPEYRGRIFERSKMDGFEVIRVWVKASPRKTRLNRLLFYLSYMVMASIAAIIWCRRRVKAVIATSPPLFVGVPAVVASILNRCPFILDVRDLWPAAAEALGELQNSFLKRAGELLESFLYKRASKITVVTRSFGRYIAKRGVSEQKIEYLPNGTMPQMFRPGISNVQWLKSLRLDGKFVVSFIGNHGIAQGLFSLLETAKMLKRHEDICFLFVGEGPVKAQLIEKCRKWRLSNVRFHPQVPLKEAPHFINMSDVLIVPLLKAPILRYFVPSKLFDYMACGKPVILCAEGESRSIVEEARAGICVEPENPRALAEAILKLYHNPKLREEMGRRGREYVLKKGFVREIQAQKLAELVKSLVKGGV